MSTGAIFTVQPAKVKGREKSHGRRSIIRDFALTTSAHGIPGIARSRTPQNRLFWSISFVAFTSITLYFVTREIINYFQYSTQTSVNIVNEWPQHFPAFTVCNLVPVRYDRFIGPFLRYIATLNATLTNDTESHYTVQSKHMADFFQMKINRNESIEEFFFPLETMLMRCLFNGRPCSAENFTSFSLSSYGLCHTFNAKLKNVDSVRFSDDHGGSGNLNLRFFVHGHQYTPYVREGSCSSHCHWMSLSPPP